jgi:hypothetical protein
MRRKSALDCSAIEEEEEEEEEEKKISLVLKSTFRPIFLENTLYVATRILKLGTKFCDLLVKVLKVDVLYVCQVTERIFASSCTLC